VCTQFNTVGVTVLPKKPNGLFISMIIRMKLYLKYYSWNDYVLRVEVSYYDRHAVHYIVLHNYHFLLV